MATQMEIEFNSDGFRQILNSSEVRAAVESTANQVCNKANSYIEGDSAGFKVKMVHSNYGYKGGRVGATIHSTDHASLVAASENKALIKAVK